MTADGEAPRIREATRADFATIQRIETAAGERFRVVGMGSIADDPPPSVEELDAYAEAGRVLVALHGDAVVGYLIWDRVDGRIHIEQVSVHPSAGRRGIGAALIDRVSGSVGGSVSLTTFEQVPWNAPYYARLGFAVVPQSEWGPQLRARMEREAARGLATWPRVAMVR